MSLSEHFCERILSQNFISEETFPANDIHSAVVSIYSDRYILQRIRKCFSECCSAKKIAGTDDFLESTRLTGFYLHSGVLEEKYQRNQFSGTR